jgi:hypothetical protein
MLGIWAPDHMAQFLKPGFSIFYRRFFTVFTPLFPVAVCRIVPALWTNAPSRDKRLPVTKRGNKKSYELRI